MKTVINILIIVLTAISFAACGKTNDPVSPVSVDKPAQTNSGTFEVTYKDYRNTSGTVTLTGTINFDFGTDVYSYNGVIVSTDKELSGSLQDSGTYTIRGNSIDMFDNAAKMMNPAWQPSLYLSGTYSYRKINNQLILEGQGHYGSVKIVLNI